MFKTETIILNIPRIQLKGFKESSSPNEAYFYLILENSLIMDGVHIGLSECKMLGEERRHITHNEAMADLRLLDRPIFHRRKKAHQYLLCDYISLGINEFLNGKEYDQVRAFLEGNLDSLDDSEFFRPSSWKGPIRVSVKFIEVYGFSGHNGRTTAHVMIGHHFVCWNVPIYPTFDPKGKIIDQRIIDQIEKIISRDRVKKLVKYLADTNSFSYEKKDHIIAKALGCNREKIPPIRFY